jgi:hypothetical protein
VTIVHHPQPEETMAEPGEFLQPISPKLARVLAQAAGAAYAPEPTFYVVARYEPASPDTGTLQPFNVQQPVATYTEAQQQVATLATTDPGVAYGIFGPFENTEGGLPLPTNQATVGHLVVFPQGGDPPEEPFTIPGTEFDALFYSIEAVEKFVLPYYEAEISPDFAQRVLNEFHTAQLALVGHLPWSEYIEVTDPDTQVVTRGNGEGAAAKYIPVFFHRDETGRVQRQPLYPPRPGQAQDAA